MKKWQKNILERYFSAQAPLNGTVNNNAMTIIEGIVSVDREKAVLVIYDGKKEWLPKSQIAIRGKEIMLPVWLYTSKFGGMKWATTASSTLSQSKGETLIQRSMLGKSIGVTRDTEEIALMISKSLKYTSKAKPSRLKAKLSDCLTKPSTKTKGSKGKSKKRKPQIKQTGRGR